MSEDLLLKQSGKIPQHVAIIMDGNGRWAKKKNLPRLAGHYRGVKTVREIVSAAAEIGIKYITLYTFSTENWKRPKDEVMGIMKLTIEVVERETEDLIKNGVRIQTIGDLDKLPEGARQAMLGCIEKTKDNDRITLTLALNYGSRWEITESVKKVAEGAIQGKWKVEDISEAMINEHLGTKGMPDPDLLIRTGGDHRISNFLLWQIAYSELFISEIHWPDFNKKHFIDVIKVYQKRERRYGMTSEQIQQGKPKAPSVDTSSVDPHM